MSAVYGPRFPSIEDVCAAQGEYCEQVADLGASHEDVQKASYAADYTLMAYFHGRRLESQAEPEAQ